MLGPLVTDHSFDALTWGIAVYLI